MCASYNAPSPRETKPHRINWLSSCCGIFEDYDPVIYHPEVYTASPTIARVVGPDERQPRRSNWLNSCCGILEDYDPVIYHPETHSASPASTKGTGAKERQPRSSNWLNSCCGILEDYDPVIYHPETYSASPASAKGMGAVEETQVSGSLWTKNILMGGKCKLPDYSGVIIYDSAGTLVSNSKPPRLALTWK